MTPDKSTSSRRQFGARLKAARERAGLSLDALALRCSEASGVQLTALRLSEIESGQVGAYAGTLRALCLALGCSADELLDLPRYLTPEPEEAPPKVAIVF